MALTQTKTLNEFFVRLTDDGTNVQGVHVSEREAIQSDGVEISSRILSPRGVSVQDATALGDIGNAINLAALASLSDKDAQIAQLQADLNTANGALTSAQTEIQALRDKYEVPATVNGVPQRVTMRQAQLALLAAGKLDAVDAAIAAIPDVTQRMSAQITWEKSSAVERSNPLIAMLAGPLGLDDATLDALFIAADKL
jgi:hypothetical protein